MNPFGLIGRAAGAVYGGGGGQPTGNILGPTVAARFGGGAVPTPPGSPIGGTLASLADPNVVQRASESMRSEDAPRNGYEMGGPGVEGYQPDTGLLPVDPTQPLPTPRGPTLVDQPPAMTGAAPWQMPSAAFAPDASQNAPRLFQDPTSQQWTLSEHGNFRPLTGDEVGGAQGYVSQFWSQNPTGFIQPGAPGYAPGQAMSNAQYGQPSNWQSLWTNAGMQPGAMNMPTSTGGMGGTLAELSNPERVNQLSQSSYGDPSLLR